MKAARIAINTQTPLVRFTRPVETPLDNGPVSLSTLTRGTDYRYTAGGVTHMIHPLLAEMKRQGLARSVVWVSLNVEDAPSLEFDGLEFEFVNLHESERKGYAEVKEGVWALLNGLREAPASPDAIDREAWAAFERYQEATGELITAKHDEEPLDLVYVHDFQQLGTARHVPRGVPRVFHLHTPFPTGVGPGWHRFFVRELRQYDTVVVSCDAYADALRAAGFRGRLRRVYPFIDPRAYPRAPAAEARAFRERFGIPGDRRVVLNVARMDPMKGQDRMIRALPALLKEVPDAHLVFVGNGSFSSSRKGGLGLSKGEQWRAHLEELTRRFGVQAHVTFTGHLPQSEVPAAFEAADAFCLPSLREGFGLAVVEAWLYEKPVVVGTGAGVSELVEDGESGLVADVNDPRGLADALARILKDPEWGAHLGAEGRRASHLACLPAGLKAVDGILTEAIEDPRTVVA